MIIALIEDRTGQDSLCVLCGAEPVSEVRAEEGVWDRQRDESDERLAVHLFYVQQCVPCLDDLVQLGFACAFDVDDHVGFDDEYVTDLLLVASSVEATSDTDVFMPSEDLWVRLKTDIVVFANVLQLLFCEAHLQEFGHGLAGLMSTEFSRPSSTSLALR